MYILFSMARQGIIYLLIPDGEGGEEGEGEEGTQTPVGIRRTSVPLFLISRTISGNSTTQQKTKINKKEEKEKHQKKKNKKQQQT